jgi:hypothetical protein
MQAKDGDVDDRAVGRAACADVRAADQEARNLLDRVLSRAQSDARQRLTSQGAQSLYGNWCQAKFSPITSYKLGKI